MEQAATHLEALAHQGDARVDDWIELLYEQALVTEGGPLEDPNGFARRITSLLATVSQASVR
jgi:molecular chaperone HtpG